MFSQSFLEIAATRTAISTSSPTTDNNVGGAGSSGAGKAVASSSQPIRVSYPKGSTPKEIETFRQKISRRLAIFYSKVSQLEDTLNRRENQNKENLLNQIIALKTLPENYIDSTHDKKATVNFLNQINEYKDKIDAYLILYKEQIKLDPDKINETKRAIEESIADIQIHCFSAFSVFEEAFKKVKELIIFSQDCRDELIMLCIKKAITEYDDFWKVHAENSKQTITVDNVPKKVSLRAKNIYNLVETFEPPYYKTYYEILRIIRYKTLSQFNLFKKNEEIPLDRFFLGIKKLIEDQTITNEQVKLILASQNIPDELINLAKQEKQKDIDLLAQSSASAPSNK